MTQDEHKAKFADTIAILVKAYLNDQLEFGNQCACAVGNILADSVGAKLVLKEDVIRVSKYTWQHPVYSGSEWYPMRNSDKELISKSGYSFDEIWRIEKAFESSRGDVSYNLINDEVMFNGLCAVVDVLAEIHGIDLKQTEEAKQLFVKV
jgi:hypothetical protein